MKSIFQSKTFWFNALTIITVVATILGYTPNQQLADTTSSLLLSITPVINIILRFYTSKAIK